MSLINNIKQNFLWRGLYLASVFVINLLMARILGAEGSGEYYLLLNNLSLVILVSGLCIESAIVYFGASGEIQTENLRGFSILWSLVAGILSLLVIYFYRPTNLSNWNAWWLSAYVFAFLLINNSTALFQSKQDFKTYNSILLATNLILIAYLLYQYLGNSAASINEKSLATLAISASFITVYAQGILLLIFSGRLFPAFQFRLPQTQHIKQILTYALQALFTNFIFFLVYRVDYWILNYYKPADDLGNYIQVSKLVQLFMLVPTLLATIILPTAAKNKTGNITQHISALGRVMFSSYFFILAILALLGMQLFPWLYGESFSGMYFPFLILVPGILALSLHSLLTSYYAGINQVLVNLTGASIALVVILLLDFSLIPTLGTKGAAIASSAGYIAYAAFMFYRFQKDHHIPFTQFLLMKSDDWKSISQLLKR